MNQQQIERTLKLHKQAYGLLIWLKEQARNNRSMLDAKALEALSSAKSCEDWVLRARMNLVGWLTKESRKKEQNK
jgi:hypothetical protein